MSCPTPDAPVGHALASDARSGRDVVPAVTSQGGGFTFIIDSPSFEKGDPTLNGSPAEVQQTLLTSHSDIAALSESGHEAKTKICKDASSTDMAKLRSKMPTDAPSQKFTSEAVAASLNTLEDVLFGFVRHLHKTYGNENVGNTAQFWPASHVSFHIKLQAFLGPRAWCERPGCGCSFGSTEELEQHMRGMHMSQQATEMELLECRLLKLIDTVPFLELSQVPSCFQSRFHGTKITYPKNYGKLKAVIEATPSMRITGERLCRAAEVAPSEEWSTQLVIGRLATMGLLRIREESQNQLRIREESQTMAASRKASSKIAKIEWSTAAIACMLEKSNDCGTGADTHEGDGWLVEQSGPKETEDTPSDTGSVAAHTPQRNSTVPHFSAQARFFVVRGPLERAHFFFTSL